MAPKYTLDIGNDLAYNNHDSLSGALYSIKSFKCMFTAANYQANDLHVNDLPKAGTWKKK